MSVPALGRLRAMTLSVLAAAALVACSSAAPDTTAQPAEPGLRTVTHAHGETHVPQDPQRIVVLEPVQLDTVVALGRKPVGAAVLSEATGVPTYLGPEAVNIPMVGTVAEPDIERIAAQRPDLILGTESRHSALYDQLAAIAPTVFMASQADPWPQNVLLVGRTLGVEQQAQKLLDDYNARCAEIAQRYGTAGKTAQLIRPRNDQLSLYGPTSFAGSTLECAGFTTPPRDWQNSISVDLSPELALQAKADHVFVTSSRPDDPSTIPSVLADNPAEFPNLHLVDQSFWITGVGPRGGLAVLDDIERILSQTAG